MGGGQSEARAFEEHEAALVRAASALADALKTTRAGYHGVAISTADVLDTVNFHLSGVPFELMHKPQGVR